MPLNIAHLSDIHFLCDPEQIGHDPNRHMRDELLEDLEVQSEKLGGLDALVVSGDIAYGGRREEFELAANWLREICERTGCSVKNVFLCPGNHDVDRQVLKKKSFIEDSHAAILNARDNERRNIELIRRLKLPDTRAHLYESLENYNNFALNFDSCFHAERDDYAWTRDLVLNDGSILRVRALNSALLSGRDDKAGTLFLGRSAWSVGREAGVEHLAFSHHPPKWLADGEDMVSEFANKVRIQLYGHEHDQRIVPSQGSVTLFAGAVNPHRLEGQWQPGYNLIQVSVNVREDARYMLVRIHAREWQSKIPMMFKPYAGTAHDMAHEVELKLRPWKQKPSAAAPTAATSATVAFSAPSPATSSAASPKEIEVPSLDAMTMQQVLYPLMEMERDRQRDVFRALSLEVPEEATLPDFLKIKRALVRAKEKGLLSKLFDLIVEENAHGH
ncbi:metallophosphoesterase [Paraburkholderia sp. USG1]|uniref:metallophosphoesterase family protein n=1 Tax=Paraburkholderia sp. USG1 TaxID=2952268 RepID=UPI00285A1172|nr:metallophosphoesterase [Paraburkholderia sp. USG1]MDR8402244.1 metallophosphoesterase [Paraburkholderia sp. USG1]